MLFRSDDDGEAGAALNVNYELVPGFHIIPEIDYNRTVSYNGPNDSISDRKGYVSGVVRFQRSF